MDEVLTELAIYVSAGVGIGITVLLFITGKTVIWKLMGGDWRNDHPNDSDH